MSEPQQRSETFLFPTSFSAEDAEHAGEAWGANCGPGALAAILDMTLQQVRPHLGEFEQKRYMNPTMMFAALRSIGVEYEVKRSTDFPRFGLARIQWEGPWTRPGVPPRFAYGKTHWVAARHCERISGTAVFDINALAEGGWIARGLWERSLVPWLLKHAVSKADGRWHITHSVEIMLAARQVANG